MLKVMHTEARNQIFTYTLIASEFCNGLEERSYCGGDEQFNESVNPLCGGCKSQFTHKKRIETLYKGYDANIIMSLYKTKTLYKNVQNNGKATSGVLCPVQVTISQKGD